MSAARKLQLYRKQAQIRFRVFFLITCSVSLILSLGMIGVTQDWDFGTTASPSHGSSAKASLEARYLVDDEFDENVSQDSESRAPVLVALAQNVENEPLSINFETFDEAFDAAHTAIKAGQLELAEQIVAYAGDLEDATPSQIVGVQTLIDHQQDNLD